MCNFAAWKSFRNKPAYILLVSGNSHIKREIQNGHRTDGYRFTSRQTYDLLRKYNLHITKRTLQPTVAAQPREIPVRKAEDQKPPELFQKSELTDITLVVEGKELHFAKHPLMAGSIVFTNMIKGSADTSRLVLDDVPYKDMIMFLECLHPKTLQVITDTNLEQVASIAHRFKQEGILHRCEEYIFKKFNKKNKSMDKMYPQFFFHLRVADKYGMKTALQAGIWSDRIEKAYFSSRDLGRHESYNTFKGYQNDENFRLLSYKTKFEILGRRLTVTEEVIQLKDPFLTEHVRILP